MDFSGLGKLFEAGVIIIVVLFITVFVSPCITYYFVNESWENETIKRGFAEHDQITGEWQWKPKAPK